MKISTKTQKEYFDNRREILAKEIFYGDRLKFYRISNRCLEFGIAFVTGGTLLTLLGDLEIPDSSQTSLTVKVGIIAFILSLIKGIWDFNKELQRYGNLHFTYSQISLELKDLIDAARNGTKEKEFRDRMGAAMVRRKQLIKEEDPNVVEKVLRTKLQNRVYKALPKENDTLEYISAQERISNKVFTSIEAKS